MEDWAVPLPGSFETEDVVACTSHDPIVTVWDVNTCTLRQNCKGHTATVNTVEWGPGNKTLLTASDDCTVRIWDSVTGECNHTVEFGAQVYQAVYSPCGKQFAAAACDNKVYLYEVDTVSRQRALEGHTDGLTSVQYSPDGTVIATGSFDHSCRLWNVSSGECMHTLDFHTQDVYGIAFAPDGKTIALASLDKLCSIVDVATGQQIHKLEGHSKWANKCAWSPDGRLLATTSADQTVKLWDPLSGQCVRTLGPHGDIVVGLSFGPDGHTLATTAGKDVVLWNYARGTKIHSWQPYDVTAWSATFAPRLSEEIDVGVVCG